MVQKWRAHGKVGCGKGRKSSGVRRASARQLLERGLAREKEDEERRAEEEKSKAKSEDIMPEKEGDKERRLLCERLLVIWQTGRL